MEPPLGLPKLIVVGCEWKDNELSVTPTDTCITDSGMQSIQRCVSLFWGPLRIQGRGQSLCASSWIQEVVAMCPLKGRGWGDKGGRCFARVQYIGHSGQQCVGSERFLEERTVEIHLISGVRRDE